MLSEDMLYLSVTDLGAKLKSGEITSSELTEAYLERSRKYGPQLNAYATLTEDRARRQAKETDAEIKAGKYRGPLHGMPYAAKDLLAVKGYPTTWGARPYQNQKFAYDAAVIAKLDRAGAVLIGKAAMIELAGGMGYRFASASATGAARNPWNTGCWTCGSSSGSGAIVSSALASFAIGTETWGSIVCPSAFCGISGLRPTFGRVSRYGAMALSYSMDKIGPMARSAEDCSVILSAIAGHDARDRGSLPAAQSNFSAKSIPRPLKIGVITNQWKALPPEIDRAFQAVLKILRSNGAVVDEVALPEGPYEMAAGLIISAEGASAFEKLIDSGQVSQLVDPLGKLGGYVSTTISAGDLLRANRIRGIFQKKADELFRTHDVLVTPTLPVGAAKIDANLETSLDFPDPIGGLGNLCGLPAISVPFGFTEEKLPIGLLFVGRVLDDAKVVQAAKLFQQHTDWHRKRPALA